MFANALRREKALLDLQTRQLIQDFEARGLLDKGSTARYTAQVLLAEASSSDSSTDTYLWLGINPPIGSYTLLELYSKLLKENPYPGSVACLEQNTRGGIRPHIHLLAKVSSNTRKNHVISKISKSWSLVPQSIDASLSKSSSLVSKWNGYIRGSKTADKMENVELDRIDREKYSIPNLISL